MDVRAGTGPGEAGSEMIALFVSGARGKANETGAFAAEVKEGSIFGKKKAIG